MNITELSIRRPVTTIMLFISMVVIGLIASFRLPLESLKTYFGITCEHQGRDYTEGVC